MWIKFKEWIINWFMSQDIQLQLELFILQAEAALPGVNGIQKKAWAVAKIDNFLAYAGLHFPLDTLVISWAVDIICTKLNELTNKDFGAIAFSATDTVVLEKATIAEVTAVSKAKGTVDERLAELYKQYGIEPEVPAKKEYVKPVITPVSDIYNWDKSIAFVMKWEGGYSNHPADNGGPTNMGITQGTLNAAYKQGIVSHNDVKNLTKEAAKTIYKRNFWDKYDWGALPWPLCMCCLDICVNHGGFAFILQRACNSLGANLDVDGKYGPKTKAALFDIGKANPQGTAAAVAVYRKDYYDKIITNNPSQEVFRKGWYNRLCDMAITAGVKSPV